MEENITFNITSWVGLNYHVLEKAMNDYYFDDEEENRINEEELKKYMVLFLTNKKLPVIKVFKQNGYVPLTFKEFMYQTVEFWLTEGCSSTSISYEDAQGNITDCDELECLSI